MADKGKRYTCSLANFNGDNVFLSPKDTMEVFNKLCKHRDNGDLEDFEFTLLKRALFKIKEVK